MPDPAALLALVPDLDGVLSDAFWVTGTSHNIHGAVKFLDYDTLSEWHSKLSASTAYEEALALS